MANTCIPVRIIAGGKICFRESAEIVKIAKKYNVVVTIQKDDKIGTSSSILSIVGIAIKTGNSVFIAATGDEPEKALNEIIHIIQ